MKKALFVAFASMFLFACGGDDEEEETVVDAGITDAGTRLDAGLTPDAGTIADGGTTTDGGTQTCLVASDLGSPTPVAQEAFSGTLDDGTAVVAGYADLNTDVDYVGVELYEGFGVFETGGIQPGTYQLTGDELSFDTCGVCVSIGADYDASTQSTAQDYLATGGTVVVESISGTFRATLTNVTFGEVDAEGAPVTGGCTSSLTSLTIDTPIQAAE